MYIASHAYTAQRETTSHFEGSKKELSLNTTTTHKTETIKKMLSESGPESVLASKGRYSHTRTFAAGRDQRAILAFSASTKRVDGFVINKDQQLVPIKPYDLPKELQQILNSDAFEAFLNDVHARLIQLHNGDFRLNLHQGLKGGVYRKARNINDIKTSLENLSYKAGGGRHESRIIIENKCNYSLTRMNCQIKDGFWKDGDGHPYEAFNENKKIARKRAGGILGCSTFGTPFGVKGYVALKIEADNQAHIIICAFHTAFLGNNKAKIETRTAISGNPITTSAFDLRSELSNTHDGNKGYTEFTDAGVVGLFNVECKFTNDTKAYFIFTFTNPKIEQRQQNQTDAVVKNLANKVLALETIVSKIQKNSLSSTKAKENVKNESSEESPEEPSQKKSEDYERM